MGFLVDNSSNRFFYTAIFCISLFFIVSVVFFFDFTVDDAFITYRYSENLVNFGRLDFNKGEAINALTSPLHALIGAVLFDITGTIEISNKVLSLFLLLFSNFILVKNFKKTPFVQLLILILTLLPSSVILWTLGGLETIILFFLVTIIINLTKENSFPYSKNNLVFVFMVAGLAFLTRYDSILFVFPILIYLANKFKSRRDLLIAILLGSLIPSIWLFHSYFYYGNIFPTSFFIKSPSFEKATLIKNGRYTILFLFYSGVIPILFLGIFWPMKIKQKMLLIIVYIKESWWLLAGIIFQILYGFSMATSHMMFSFRFFVPYLPATVFWIINFILTLSKESYSRKIENTIKVFLILLLMFQGYQLYVTYNKSVNGLSPLGEYQDLGVADYNNFIDVMEMEAGEIKEHWENNRVDRSSIPIIFTYAEGKLPYSYQEAFILGKLISYQGKNIAGIDYSKYANYIQILTPRHGSIESQLPFSESEYFLVSSHELFFDGSYNSFQIYFNPNPKSLSEK